MRFVVDGMLGGLARWLRMLGYITEYSLNAKDGDLLSSSVNNGSILLTRDQELYLRAKSRNITSVLVVGEKEEERLGQLARVLGVSLEIEMANTRCPMCGATLRAILKEEASNTVPATSLGLYDRFWKCSDAGCGKTYWIGSHWKQILHTLGEARKIAAKER